MLDFAHGKRSQTFCLSGKAGAGKTLLIQALIKKLRDEGNDLKICFTAPTNKAVKVLREMAEPWELDVDFKTCAKLLGIAPMYDPETGEETFERSSSEDSDMKLYDLVVVDECSMAGTALFGFLIEEAYAQRTLFGNIKQETLILFMGDHYQAPPVGEPLSKTFEATKDCAVLSESMRFEGAIEKVVEDFRANLNRRNVPHYQTDHSKEKGGVVSVPVKTWNAHLCAAFKKTSGNTKTSGSIRAIAYTNDRVKKLNAMVRAQVHGPNAPQFVVGERLISDSHFTMSDRNGQEVKLFSVSEEMIVTHAVRGKSGDFKVWYLTVQIAHSDLQPVTVPVLDSGSQKDFDKHLANLQKLGRYEAYFSQRDRFAKLNYAYAITAHKAQGSTYKTTFVDIPNFAMNETHHKVKFPGASKAQLVYERNQLMYVACSRAAHNLFIKTK